MASSPVIEEYYLGPGRAESFFFSEGELCAMAIQPDLPDASRRAREIQAWGMWARPPIGGKRLSVWPRSLAELDPVAVAAQRRFVEAMQPEWVERVRDEWRTYRDEVEVVYWSELPPETVRAILTLLHECGEIVLSEEA